jgi:peptidoglycan/xylan/chitin deacetylase (PgdA/CDA1 family)
MARLNRKRSKPPFIKYIFFTIVVLGIAGYGGWQVSAQIQAAAPSSNYEVNLVSTLPQTNMQKEIPQKYNGKTRKIAYLTFDDGPGEYTNQLLDILKQHDAKATFFVLGSNVNLYKDVAKREVNEGHYIAMHSMTHDYKKLYGQQTFLPEMKENQQIIQDVTGQHSNLVRAPYGSMPGLNKALRDQVADAQLKLWDWTIDSLDWKYNRVPLNQSVPAIVNLVVSQSTKDKEVILFHDIHAQSVQAIPLIIQKLKEQGYEFEAYDEKEHFIVNFWHDQRL